MTRKEESLVFIKKEKINISIFRVVGWLAGWLFFFSFSEDYYAAIPRCS